MQIACPKCEKRYKAKPEWNGKKVKCVKCETRFVVEIAAAPAVPPIAQTQQMPPEPPKVQTPPVNPPKSELAQDQRPVAPDGEITLHTSSPKMFRNRPILFLLFVVLTPFGAGLLLLAIWFLRCITAKLIITDRRTTYRRGILSKRTNEVRHVDVRNLLVEQSLGQRIFGVGRLDISSSGQGGFEVSAAGISAPQKLADTIRKYQG